MQVEGVDSQGKEAGSGESEGQWETDDSDEVEAESKQMQVIGIRSRLKDEDGGIAGDTVSDSDGDSHSGSPVAIGLDAHGRSKKRTPAQRAMTAFFHELPKMQREILMSLLTIVQNVIQDPIYQHRVIVDCRLLNRM